MYAKVYKCGEFLEVTAMRTKPQGPERPDYDTVREILTGEEVAPNRDDEYLDTVSQMKAIEEYETGEQAQQRREANFLRNMRATKQTVRRYVKKYNLVNMYTLTFAENLPLSKKAESYGHWGTRSYKGKLRRVWLWKEGRQPKGERIENNVYINRLGDRYDLTKKEDAWYLFEKFIRRLTAAGISFNYIATTEYQKRGVLHFHIATNQTADGIRRVWGLGHVGTPRSRDGKPYKTGHDSAYKYITKYITKDIGFDSVSGEGRPRRFRNSKCFTIEKVQIDRNAADYDDLLQSFLDDRTADGITSGDIRIYTSEQFDLGDFTGEWVVFHISPT